MNEHLNIISRCQLFAGLSVSEIEAQLTCLKARKVSLGKGESLFLEGSAVADIFIVAEGLLHIVQEDFYGNRNLIAVIHPGDMCAEAFTCARVECAPVSAFAAQESSVIALSVAHILNPCSTGCSFHAGIIANLLRVTARKNVVLTEKIRCMAKKTTREKILEYLTVQARLHGSREFTIPLNRQGLADYLSVDRSALSVEINKLKREEVIDTKGSWFKLQDC